MMNNIKNKFWFKFAVFVLLQLCVVSTVLSCLIVAVNANFSWYSSSPEKVKEMMLSEIAADIENEIHDGLWYELEFYNDNAAWPQYLLKDYDIPAGIGYKIEFFKEKPGNLSEIKLQKNIKNLSDIYGTYKSELYNDRYHLTIYVADPEQVDMDIQEMYPERLSTRYELMHKIYQYRNISIAVFAVSVILLILSLIILVTSIKKGKNSAILKLPLDIVCVAALALSVCVGLIMLECFNSYNVDIAVIGLISGSLGISIILTGFILIGASEIKTGTWWKKSLIFFMIRIAKKIIFFVIHKVKILSRIIVNGIRKVPLVWKTVVVTGGLLILNFIIAVNLSWYGFALICWVIGSLLVGAGVIYTALCMKRIQDGGRRLAEGDLEYKIETRGLYMDFKEHANNLNSIGEGMAAAVNEKTKSERFKAELITNVSHDIKTPLTSIINYVDLLNKEEIDNDKVNEYIEVLDRQSKRLKKLTEDLVDASKASTGNVKIDLTPCKIGLLVQQTMAEYKEKAENHDLEFIMKLPEEDMEILADGRRLWRVLDNLLNNICKYAQPGTRVYMNLDKEADLAVLTYRNISKYELDITEEELMERFVRGDKSRNTEGSGLGLSIARNLVELQGGDFDISIDGDLFKVIIKFKLLNL